MGTVERRDFLKATGLSLLALSASGVRADTSGGNAQPALNPDTVPGPAVRKRAPLAPVKASMDRLISLEACLRPFRAQGPRIEAERMGRKTIVHNYGHGGSGWSLSWGAGRR